MTPLSLEGGRAPSCARRLNAGKASRPRPAFTPAPLRTSSLNGSRPRPFASAASRVDSWLYTVLGFSFVVGVGLLHWIAGRVKHYLNRQWARHVRALGLEHME